MLSQNIKKDPTKQPKPKGISSILKIHRERMGSNSSERYKNICCLSYLQIGIIPGLSGNNSHRTQINSTIQSFGKNKWGKKKKKKAKVDSIKLQQKQLSPEDTDLDYYTASRHSLYGNCCSPFLQKE